MTDQDYEVRHEDPDFLEYCYTRVWEAMGGSPEHASILARCISFGDRYGKLTQGMGVFEIPVAMAASLNELQTTLESFSPGSPFYDQLERAVGELNRTLQSVEEASRTIGEQPSTVIFSKPIEPDPEPNP